MDGPWWWPEWPSMNTPPQHLSLAVFLLLHGMSTTFTAVCLGLRSVSGTQEVLNMNEWMNE